VEAAGGEAEFLERYAVILCSDHGQTEVSEIARLQDHLPDVLVTASNRAGMAYIEGEAGPLARRLDGAEGVELVLFREGDEAIARRGGEELRFRRTGSSYSTTGDEGILGYPNGLERAWAALANPNAGELLVSAAPGWEFSDLGGRHHLGGGSHGSLTAGDSEVPMLTIGLERRPTSITDVMPLALEHFGVPPPPYARARTAP